MPHVDCNESNTTCAACGGGTAYRTLPEHLSSENVIFCVMFCWSLFVLFFLFILTMIYVVLRYTASDNPFGIIKLFLHVIVFRSKISLIILFYIWCEMTLNSGLLNMYSGFPFMKYGLHNRLWVSDAICNNYFLLWNHGYFVNTTNLPKSLTRSNT